MANPPLGGGKFDGGRDRKESSHMKILVLVFVMVSAGGVWAQEDDSGNGSDAAYTGKVFVNAGIGIGVSMGKARSSGARDGIDGFASPFQMPFSMGVDVKLPLNSIPNLAGGQSFLTLGGTFYFSSLYKSPKIRDLGFGIRPAVYINGLNLFENLFKNVDSNKLTAYMAIPIGYVNQSWEGETMKDQSGFFLGLDVGTKYFFIKNVGAYAELNLNTRWIGGSIGVAARF
jgi:hypothetical protein